MQNINSTIASIDQSKKKLLQFTGANVKVEITEIAVTNATLEEYLK